MTRDPQFGPVLAVGAGGVAVEELGRVALAAAPLDRETALELVADAGLEEGAATLAATLVALSRLALTHPEIAEIDVNPLILDGDVATAVDALIVIDRGAAT